MNKVILLHGTEGSSNSGWLLWLKSELQSKGIEVWVPDLPNAGNPSLKEWTEHVLEKCPFVIDSATSLIGHSAGAVAVLIIAQRLKNPIKQIVSVASFKDLSYLHESLDWHANDSFFDIDFDFKKIKQNCDDILFIHSDNDPYCPLDHAEYLTEKTAGKLLVLPGQKHFNLEASESYKKFPELVKFLN